MKIRLHLPTVLGVLLFAVALTLSLPGVRVAQADGHVADFDRFEQFVGQRGGHVAAQPDASQCGDRPVRTSRADVAAAMERARQLAAAHADGDSQVVMLNVSGYNYRPDRPGVVKPDHLRPERLQPTDR